MTSLPSQGFCYVFFHSVVKHFNFHSSRIACLPAGAPQKKLMPLGWKFLCKWRTLHIFLPNAGAREIILCHLFFFHLKNSCIMSMISNKWHCKETHQPHSPCIHAEISELYFHGWREKKKESGRKELTLAGSHSHANKGEFTLTIFTTLNLPPKALQIFPCTPGCVGLLSTVLPFSWILYIFSWFQIDLSNIALVLFYLLSLKTQ